VVKVGTSKAGGTISQQAAVHTWHAADAHGNKQTRQSKDGNSRATIPETPLAIIRIKLTWITSKDSVRTAK
jgi:hypothetical protein